MSSQSSEECFSVSSTLRTHAPPSLPFKEVKDDILGKTYELSLAFVGNKRIHTLNATYRNKDYVTNVLSFPFSKTEGEIIICLPKAKQETRNYNTTYKQHILYLYIHGLLHLTGLRHGKKMEQLERRFLEKYTSSK